jgi:hypothetical protein
MHTRLLTIAASLYLTLALLACSKQPSDSAASGGSDSGSATTLSGTNDKGDKEPTREVKPLVVPSGTVVTVRLGESLGSKISEPGQTFSATVMTPVVVDGETVIPKGAEATGTVVDAKPLGRFKGGAVLQVRLDSISVAGTNRPVQTSAVTRIAKGKGKRTAVMAGGGAGLGALIGGLAGGGKGAAIGAIAGGGAGTAGAAFTGNKDIVLPAESALSFKLEKPLEVR